MANLRSSGQTKQKTTNSTQLSFFIFPFPTHTYITLLQAVYYNPVSLRPKHFFSCISCRHSSPSVWIHSVILQLCKISVLKVLISGIQVTTYIKPDSCHARNHCLRNKPSNQVVLVTVGAFCRLCLLVPQADIFVNTSGDRPPIPGILTQPDVNYSIVAT